MFVSKKTPELLNQLQASSEEMYNTGAKIAMLPWNSRVTCVQREEEMVDSYAKPPNWSQVLVLVWVKLTNIIVSPLSGGYLRFMKLQKALWVVECPSKATWYPGRLDNNSSTIPTWEDLACKKSDVCLYICVQCTYLPMLLTKETLTPGLSRTWAKEVT